MLAIKRTFPSIAVLGVVLSFLWAVSAAADVNNFTISSYDIDYTLSQDTESRSVLKTVETITAEFPQFDQNHGIERAIPKTYDNHSTSLKIVSVTDETGQARSFTTYDSNGNLVVRIGDADSYVRGRQAYVITYTQRDVTRFFANTNADEFYWDTNGTEWQVPIQKLSVTLRLNDELMKSLSGERACYQGAVGSSLTCSLTQNGSELRTEVSNLGSGENVTIAVGFVPHTFAAYQLSWFEKFLIIAIPIWIVLSFIPVGIIIWMMVRWSNWTSRKKELGPIAPEYIPPKDVSVTAAASVISGSTKTFAAQIVDFAVRHYIKIYETEKKVWFFKKKDYELEIIRDISDLNPEEREILSDIFTTGTAVGQRLALSSLQNNTGMYYRIQDNDKKLENLVRGTYGLREQNTGQSAWFKRVGKIMLVCAVIFLSPVFLIGGLLAFGLGHFLWPLSDKGLALSRYLEGLKMYIKVAETERLKMMQSPDGAQKVGGVDPNNPQQLVKLYERVLPYAILFGQEKEWNNQLGKYYESLNQQPDWYRGNNSAAFNAATFSSAMSGLSNAASYSSASSSSSGGSSGGGSSGGGGGGGGGGDW